MECNARLPSAVRNILPALEVTAGIEAGPVTHHECNVSCMI